MAILVNKSKNLARCNSINTANYREVVRQWLFKNALFVFAGVKCKGLDTPLHVRDQFLKAPTLLALLMKFFRRSWSISANPEVWVTTVRWFMQNLKQNSSKS